MCRAHNNVLKCSEEQVLRQVMGLFLAFRELFPLL